MFQYDKIINLYHTLYHSLSQVTDGIHRWDCENLLKSLEKFSLNPLTPMSDQDRISPYRIAIQYQPDSDENKEKYQFGDN